MVADKGAEGPRGADDRAEGPRGADTGAVGPRRADREADRGAMRTEGPRGRGELARAPGDAPGRPGRGRRRWMVSTFSPVGKWIQVGWGVLTGDTPFFLQKTNVFLQKS